MSTKITDQSKVRMKVTNGKIQLGDIVTNIPYGENLVFKVMGFQIHGGYMNAQLMRVSDETLEIQNPDLPGIWVQGMYLARRDDLSQKPTKVKFNWLAFWLGGSASKSIEKSRKY